MSAKTVPSSARSTAAGNLIETKKSDPYYLRAVGKAIEVYQILERSPGPIPLHQMARLVGLTKSSVYRILHTLEIYGSIRKASDGRYEIAGEDRIRIPALSISRVALASVEPLKELVRNIGETVGLAILFDNRIEVVSVVESPHVIRMGNIPGRILPPHASALGKCITAFQPEESRERLLRAYGTTRYTVHTITDYADLDREFAAIRAEGFARDLEESALDGVCFAAPVYDSAGKVVGGISISVPKFRIETINMERMLSELCRAAQAVSAAIG